MSGKTQISLSDFEGCNKTTESGCSVSEICCSFNQISFNLNYDSIFNCNFSKKLNFTIAAKEFISILLKPAFTNLNFNFYTNLPPPGGYDLLKLVQVFRL